MSIVKYPMADSKPYINQKLTYTDDGRLLDEDGNAVMMDWESPIMEKSAEIVCRKGGKILNVGFGLGLVDFFIEKYDIEEHWIIEPHIDVNVKDEKGRSLIILSLLVIDKDTHNFIEFQIKKGANVNITDFEGNSPLHYIAKYKP